MIRYYQEVVNPPDKGIYTFSNLSKLMLCLEAKQILLGLGFMFKKYEDQILVAYGVGKRSFSSCITVTFKDKTIIRRIWHTFVWLNYRE